MRPGGWRRRRWPGPARCWRSTRATDRPRLVPPPVRMVATSATRDAANAADFVTGVRGVLGHRARRCSPGTRRRCCRSPARPPSSAGGPRRAAGRPPYLVADIGGGSTEFVLGGSGRCVTCRRLGGHRLRPADRAAPARRPADRQRRSAAATADIDAALARGRGDDPGHRRPHPRRPGRLGDDGGRARARAARRTTPPGSTTPGSAPGRCASRTPRLLARPHAERAGIGVDASRPGRRDRRRGPGAGPDHDPVRLHRGARQRARHPGRHRLVAGTGGIGAQAEPAAARGLPAGGASAARHRLAR